MQIGTIGSIIIILAVIYVAYCWMQNGKKYLTQRPKKVESVTVKKDIDEVFKKICSLGDDVTYKVDGLDEGHYTVVLSDPVKFPAGKLQLYFYPIHLTQQGEDTLIEIGIATRGLGFGKMTENDHNSFVTKIKLMFQD